MKRASGTFWERQLVSNWIIIIPLAYLLGVRRFDNYLIGFGLCLFVMLISGLIDFFTYMRFDLQRVYCDNLLWIGDAIVQPEHVISLRTFYLRATKNNWHFVEIHYRIGETDMRALCISKPVWIWFIGRENPTIRVVLEHFPSLKDKVLPQYDADGYKEIRDPSLRKLDPIHTPEQPHVYRTTHPRDPYFNRRK